MNRTRDIRRHHRERVIRDRAAVWLITDTSYRFGDPKGVLPFAEGRFAKKHPFDCGKPNCPVCQRPRYGKADRQRIRQEIVECRS